LLQSYTINMQTRITQLLNIQYPIIQAGMVWCSGWELASAVCNAGGLGIIGSGSMNAETLRIHIRKTKQHTSKPFAVNIPLLYSKIEETINVVIEEQVPIVFTSAGNPATWTKKLKDYNIIVVHVIANSKFALKCADAGVDAIVAEGFEAGGHNGREETTTMTLIPLIKSICSLPLIAAGGIATGRGMLAAMALGAEGVQIGSRFVASTESSAHPDFKQMVTNTPDGGTRLAMRNINPVRLIKNEFSNIIEEAENKALSKEQILEILGKGRAKLGMFEGNLTDGELEIGQVAAIIHNIKPAALIIKEIIDEYIFALNELNKL
jgi:enoyl-[acyl-carrier protein] reductase II